MSSAEDVEGRCNELLQGSRPITYLEGTKKIMKSFGLPSAREENPAYTEHHILVLTPPCRLEIADRARNFV
jgi:hypothetical protein